MKVKTFVFAVQLTVNLDQPQRPLLSNCPAEFAWAQAKSHQVGGKGRKGTRHSVQRRRQGAEKTAQSQPTEQIWSAARVQHIPQIGRDWASLLHWMAVLYGGPLPKRWMNQMLSQPPEQVRQTVRLLVASRYQNLKRRAFRRLLWRMIGGEHLRTSRSGGRRVTRAKTQPDYPRQLSIFEL